MAKEKNKETPLMRQYNAIKAKYPGTVLLFRVGDFYETFGEDAIKVADILDIVLTKRSNGAAAHVELAGFPHHALDSYLPRLVKAGQRVAVCDQLEDPKQAKGIVKRGVTELVTPGVALSDKILDTKENNYLASVHFAGKNLLGAAFIEASTGEFFCYSGTHHEVRKLLSALKPAEILVPRRNLQQFHAFAEEKFYVTRLEDWVFQEEYAKEKLLQHFKTNSLKGFGIEEDLQGIIASGAIMHYLLETQQANLGHITKITGFNDSDYVHMDTFTVRNLELTYPNHPDGQALIDIIDHCATAMGSRMMRNWLLFPLKTLSKIKNRQEAVAAFLENRTIKDRLQDQLKAIGDLERLASKLATYKLQPREAASLKNSLHLLPKILETLKEIDATAIKQKRKSFIEVTEITATLQQYLAEEVSAQISQGGVIAEGLSAELDELRSLSANGKDLLLQMQKRESERTGITSLKIGFNKVFGYYLEVTNAHKDKVPPDFIRKQTLTNSERYITEELKQYEEKILTAEEKILSLEQQLYQELLHKLQPYIATIQHNAKLIASLDILLSFATTAHWYKYTQPEINSGNQLDIRAGRHPVIERNLPKDSPYIPNDVFLDNEQQQIIIITGPNMAGKSALLRQTALIVLLAQIGAFVPAEAAKIGIVDKIFTRVGASDNISSGESTFMVEMNESARIINNATPKSLILLDEIGRGTSTYDGVSIAWALVEYLHEVKKSAAKTLFATHYHELNELTNRLDRVKNYNVSVKEIDNKIIFMRKLLPGGSEHSFGIHVAEMAGMPGKIIQRANELLQHFEQNKLKDQDQAKRVKFSSKQKIQLNMFELKDEDTVKIRQILAGVDVDRMTPVEALLKLQEIKQAITSS